MSKRTMAILFGVAFFAVFLTAGYNLYRDLSIRLPDQSAIKTSSILREKRIAEEKQRTKEQEARYRRLSVYNNVLSRRFILPCVQSKYLDLVGSTYCLQLAAPPKELLSRYSTCAANEHGYSEERKEIFSHALYSECIRDEFIKRAEENQKLRDAIVLAEKYDVLITLSTKFSIGAERVEINVSADDAIIINFLTKSGMSSLKKCSAPRRFFSFSISDTIRECLTTKNDPIRSKADTK